MSEEIWRVRHIFEPDFGCEGRPDNYVQMDTVVIENGRGESRPLSMGDALLYERHIDEGDAVRIAEDGTLVRAD